MEKVNRINQYEVFGRDSQKVHVVKYADDFIITGASREVLEQTVKPAVEAFLWERGLELSAEKTNITHINDGFDFLGFNVRKYAGELLIKPAKASVKAFLGELRRFIKANRAAKTEHLVRLLNRKIRGWANFYRHVVAKKTLAYVERGVEAFETEHRGRQLLLDGGGRHTTNIGPDHQFVSILGKK